MFKKNQPDIENDARANVGMSPGAAVSS